MESRGTTREKALKVNLSSGHYGTFAEIGAGQEVVRWFFQAGGAAGTISKSISAYDMQVSDAIYGECERYVCRERLDSMLDKEQTLNRTRLASDRGDANAFFTFADTVSARNFSNTNESHGWMGIRFQANPHDEDSSIVIHVRMLDAENSAQQEALGIVGVNLIYGAFFLGSRPQELIESLLDGLSTDRIEIDVIDFGGEEFRQLDNRVMSLHLVQLGLTGAVLFAADGTVLQPSEILRKRSLLIERGRFRPVTHVNLDMLNAGLREFELVADVEPGETLPIMEITMRNLKSDSNVCLEDFISRAEVLETTGHTVMISDFFEYYRLAAYLFRYTHRPIGLAMGIGTLRQLFDEHYYEELDGGIFESFGRLFKDQLKLMVYPWKNAECGFVETLHNVEINPSLRQLYDFLRDRRSIMPIEDITHAYLDIHSDQVLEMIASGNDEWVDMVPTSVACAIKRGGLFGYAAQSQGRVA